MEDIKNLAKAMSEAFPEIEGVIRDKVAHKYKYADLSTVIAAIKPALQSRGLWFIQKVHPTPDYANVETIIMHSSGESLSCGILSIPVPKNDAQGYGSALTYARRYSLTAAFGVAQEDDDGKAACPKREAQSWAEEQDEPQEVQKLGAGELRKLATKVVGVLNEDVSLHCSIHVDDMFEYLAHYQQFKTLQPAVDEALEKGRKHLLNSFTKWQTTKAA